ncbi:hypothetical protein G4B88_011811 [Cannabis sativa]|uniref:RNase H type-1 domain-containing protein n=1 Tax=Cannabis sativa TaxID=3483 RepID=A0A7J6EGQ6_CANSA|nr:hypothetical protein G4B88_011811 [Cannabis sativa]
MAHIVKRFGNSWAIIGDLNVIHEESEKQEGRYVDECSRVPDAADNSKEVDHWDMKLVVDASILDDSAGLGVVQMDEHGDQAITIMQASSVSGVLEAELLPIRVALHLALEENCSFVKILSYSAQAVQALAVGEISFAWGSYSIFSDCLSLKSLFECCSVVFIPRSSNSLANSVARYARINRINSKCVLREIAPFVAIS